MENLNESNIDDQSSGGSHTEEIHLNQDFNDISQDITESKELIQRLITESMAKVEQVETKSENQEKEIIDLMYKLHWYTFQINSIKEQLPKPTFAQRPYKPKSTLKYKNDETNTSIQSINSKRSSSTLRKDYGKQVGRNYGAQKVSINIGGQANDDTATVTTTRKTTKERVNDIKSLEKNLKPKGSCSNVKNINVVIKSKEVPVKVNTVRSPKDSMDINDNRGHSNKLLSSNYFSLKSNLTNTTSESLQTTKNNNFKFEPKKKQQTDSNSIANDYINIPSKDNVSSVSGNKTYFNNPIKSLFNNENNSNIFIKILECCKNTSERLKFKGISKHMRKKYYQYEIRHLETLKQYKQTQMNPFFNIKITDGDEVFNKKFVLSDNLRKNDKNEQFINLVRVLYIILIDSSNVRSERTINEMIDEIEAFKSRDKNIYSKYKDIIHSLKSNVDVYSTIKELYSGDVEILKFDSIINITSMDILFELMMDMKSILDNKTPKVDLILDIEILTHKIETLKSLNSQF
jgi:hypothetical protein